MVFGIHFDCCGSLRDPVPGLLFSLGIYVELGHEVLDLVLVLGGQEARIKLPSQGQLIIALCAGSIT